jgi:hypothetical protein
MTIFFIGANLTTDYPISTSLDAIQSISICLFQFFVFLLFQKKDEKIFKGKLL